MKPVAEHSKSFEEEEQPAVKKMKIDEMEKTARCVLRWAKLSEHAIKPTRGSQRAAGVDLHSAYDMIVPARGRAVVKTDLQVQVPEGTYGRVAPRSGLAVKNFIDVGAGVVDEDYRGNLGVVLFNHSDEEFAVKRGDRIAQFICERIMYPELEEVDKLDETARGEGGFGSTGVGEIKKTVEADEKKKPAEKIASDKKEDAEEKMATDEKMADEKSENGKKVEIPAAAV